MALIMHACLCTVTTMLKWPCKFSLREFKQNLTENFLLGIFPKES